MAYSTKALNPNSCPRCGLWLGLAKMAKHVESCTGGSGRVRRPKA